MMRYFKERRIESWTIRTIYINFLVWLLFYPNYVGLLMEIALLGETPLIAGLRSLNARTQS